MATVPNTDPLALGAGAIVKFNGDCIVFAKLVAGESELLMGTISPNDSFTAKVPGDYLFVTDKSCCGDVTYDVLFAGEGGGKDCPCTEPVIVDGKIVGITIDGVAWVPEDTNTQNTHALDEDGNLVITSPDGSTSTTYVINQDTLLGPLTDPDGDGIYTAEVLDADGEPTGETVDSDFNALLSSPHPEPIPDTYMSAVVNEDGSITLQYMNEDGAVGDPVVIPAPVKCIWKDSLNNRDLGCGESLSVQRDEMLDHFDVDPATNTTNGLNQYIPKYPILFGSRISGGRLYADGTADMWGLNCGIDDTSDIPDTNQSPNFVSYPIPVSESNVVPNITNWNRVQNISVSSGGEVAMGQDSLTGFTVWNVNDNKASVCIKWSVEGVKV